MSGTIKLSGLPSTASPSPVAIVPVTQAGTTYGVLADQLVTAALGGTVATPLQVNAGSNVSIGTVAAGGMVSLTINSNPAVGDIYNHTAGNNGLIINQGTSGNTVTVGVTLELQSSTMHITNGSTVDLPVANPGTIGGVLGVAGALTLLNGVITNTGTGGGSGGPYYAGPGLTLSGSTFDLLLASEGVLGGLNTITGPAVLSGGSLGIFGNAVEIVTGGTTYVATATTVGNVVTYAVALPSSGGGGGSGTPIVGSTGISVNTIAGAGTITLGAASQGVIGGVSSATGGASLSGGTIAAGAPYVAGTNVSITSSAGVDTISTTGTLSAPALFPTIANAGALAGSNLFVIYQGGTIAAFDTLSALAVYVNAYNAANLPAITVTGTTIAHGTVFSIPGTLSNYGTIPSLDMSLNAGGTFQALGAGSTVSNPNLVIYPGTIASPGTISFQLKDNNSGAVSNMVSIVAT